MVSVAISEYCISYNFTMSRADLRFAPLLCVDGKASRRIDAQSERIRMDDGVIIYKI